MSVGRRQPQFRLYRAFARFYDDQDKEIVHDMARYDHAQVVEVRVTADRQSEAILRYPIWQEPSRRRWLSFSWDIEPLENDSEGDSG